MFVGLQGKLMGGQPLLHHDYSGEVITVVNISDKILYLSSSISGPKVQKE